MDSNYAIEMIFKMIGPALLKNPFLVLSSSKNWPWFLHKVSITRLENLLNIDKFRGNLIISGSGLPKSMIYYHKKIYGNPEIKNRYWITYQGYQNLQNPKFNFQGSQKLPLWVAISQKELVKRFQKIL